MSLTADDFADELSRILDEAEREGRKHIDVNAGEIHKGLGGYPGTDHRVPVCCNVMKAAMVPNLGDKVLHEPPSGRGTSLTIPTLFRAPPWSHTSSQGY